MIAEDVPLEIDADLQSCFPGLYALAFRVKNLDFGLGEAGVEELIKRVTEEIRLRYTLEGLKDVPVFRAYRDFFWKIGIDPTKMRPSSEALVRRVLMGREFPRINLLVDLYNLASMKTGITMAAYDDAKIEGRLKLSWGVAGERFRGIGMDKEIFLKGNEVVLRDDSSVLSIYPYRDSDHSKTDNNTRSATIMACGVPGIDIYLLREAKETLIEYLSLVLDR
ncbi:MAG: phenylalanine--tRNA ligase beta subunit-related protein [Nitrososphaerota archaeon]